MSGASLLTSVDDLYAAVVTDPDAWGEEAFADWSSDVAVGGVDQAQMRALRRCLRIAQRLRDFWAGDRPQIDAGDWRSRVDLALGPRAWRPTLELAMASLDAEPSPELFDEVRHRFRLVNGAPWMEGVSYEEWRTSLV